MSDALQKCDWQKTTHKHILSHYSPCCSVYTPTPNNNMFNAISTVSKTTEFATNVIELVTILDPLSLLCDPPNRAELSVAPRPSVCPSVTWVRFSWNRKVDQFTSRNIFARPTDRLCDICLRLFRRAACLGGRLAVHLQYTSLTGDHSHSHSHSANLVNLFTAACVDTQTIQWREVYFWNKKSNCSMHAEYLIVVC